MRIYTTTKVAPKRNRTTIKKILEREFKWNKINTAGITKAKFFHYKFIGKKESPEFLLIVGISYGSLFEGDKVELIVRGTNAHRLTWLLSNKYKIDKKAKSYKGAQGAKGGKFSGNKQSKQTLRK